MKSQCGIIFLPRTSPLYITVASNERFLKESWTEVVRTWSIVWQAGKYYRKLPSESGPSETLIKKCKFPVL